MFHVPGSKLRLPKKCVPFLGEYLKDLKVMDSRMEDDLEVQRVLEEIVVLQEAAQKYKIEPEEQFQAWFWALKRLSKMRGEAGQELGKGRAGLFLLVSPENLCPWFPDTPSPQTLLCSNSWGS
ncbi:ral guanine nucleotide dissociation stimulator-like [Myotis daubentonii]|uniref:ral guanine nucleotide dissociation stimulator-like n=1 Tax=Myotis daubentonii TaxID=98922 RepID=UPI0028732E7E|nr:ral guanine nucleotide dissociation stimulator-like [Myotis daubentonii]